MIWLAGKGSPSARRSLAGRHWPRWKGPNANREMLLFVSQDRNMNDFSVAFFDYIVQNGRRGYAAYPGDLGWHGAVHGQREPVHVGVQCCGQPVKIYTHGSPPVIDVLRRLNYRGANVANINDDRVVEELLK